MGWLRGVNIVLALLFVFAMAVQYNDPDPLPWMGIYGGAGGVCAWSALRPATLRWWLPALVATVALAWAIRLAPQVWGKVRLAEMFASFEMKSVEVEVARETCGLLAVAAAMAVAALGRRDPGADREGRLKEESS